MRRDFGVWAENEIDLDADFHRKILFSDEAHFWLNGYVEPAAAATCPKSYLNINAIKLSFQ